MDSTGILPYLEIGLESVISPNGFQFDVFGKLTPPETGQGREIGILSISSPDNVITRTDFIALFQYRQQKNEQRQNINRPMLQAIYPSV